MPYGYSGAGVWCDPTSQPGTLWTADPILLGVQTRAYARSGLFYAAGADVIREFLEHDLS
jgi:hypothetical protein